MKRRDFFKILFGGLAAAVAKPSIAVSGRAFGNLASTLLSATDSNLLLARPPMVDWTAFTQTFDFSTESLAAKKSRLLSLPETAGAKNLITAFRLYYNPESTSRSVADFMQNIEFQVKAKDRLIGSFLPWLMPMDCSQRLVWPLLADDLSISLSGPQLWIPPENLNGQVIVEGIQVSAAQIEP